MRRHTNQRRQSLLLAAIATIVLLGASASTFAWGTAKNNRARNDYLSPSTASQNPWRQNPLEKFALTNFHSNALFAANVTAAFDCPKPDFSEMEQWYEIVRYEYGDPAADNTLYFYVKPKVEQRPKNFCMQFRDKDGVLVDPFDTTYGNGIQLDSYLAVGEVAKAKVYTPFETAMKRVVSAKVVRMKG